MARDFRPRGIGAILDEAIAVIRANWRTLLAVTGIAVLPVAMAYSILSTFYTRALFETIGAIARSAGLGGQPPAPDPMMAVVSTVASAMGLVYLLARVYFSSTLYAAAGPLMEGRPPAARQMLKAGWRGFFPLLVVEMVAGMAAYLGALVTFPLLGVGGAVVAVLLSMAGPVVVIEGNIGQAFARSWRLVRPHFWRVLVLVVGAYLVATQFESALLTPVVLREVVFGIRQQSVLTSQLAWGWKLADGALQGFATAVALPFMQLAVLLCYLDLRAREEGMDLIIRARAILHPVR
jgi:hypothetical protein